jgi:hypothetical protein
MTCAGRHGARAWVTFQVPRPILLVWVTRGWEGMPQVMGELRSAASLGLQTCSAALPGRQMCVCLGRQRTQTPCGMGREKGQGHLQTH